MDNLGFLLADVAAITQIALGLAGLLAQLVILISFGALDLTGTGGLKTLGSRAAGFNLSMMLLLSITWLIWER